MLHLFLIALGFQYPGGHWNQLHLLTNPSTGGSYGWEVELIGDLDQDGRSEILVGAPYLDLGIQVPKGGVYVYSGATGAEMFRVTSLDHQAADLMGWTAAAVGDVNQDGTPDFAFAARSPNGQDPFSVFVYSGATFTLLARLWGPPGYSNFGFSGIAGGHDLNGDAVPDIVIGARNHSGPLNNQGAVYAYDSLTWQQLWMVEGAIADEEYGGEVSCVADLSGDGLGDVLVHVNRSYQAIRALSGVDGSELYRILEPYGAAIMGGLGMEGIGDLDRDGREDFVANQHNTSYPQHYGHINVFSGRDGRLLHQIRGEVPRESFPGRVIAVGDLDGDGLSEFAGSSGKRIFGYGDGIVYVYSSRDWGVLARIPAPLNSSLNFGWAMSGKHDVDGDGLPDLAFGDSHAEAFGIQDNGAAYIYSFDPWLGVSSNSVSATNGGQLDFDIRFPASEAGAEYRLLVSADRPGSRVFDKHELPLVESRWTYMLAQNQPAWFSGVRGQLNVNGHAFARAQVPAGLLSGYVGKSLQFAAVTLRPPGKKLSLSTASVFVEIDP